MKATIRAFFAASKYKEIEVFSGFLIVYTYSNKKSRWMKLLIQEGARPFFFRIPLNWQIQAFWMSSFTKFIRAYTLDNHENWNGYWYIVNKSRLQYATEINNSLNSANQELVLYFAYANSILSPLY